MDSVNPSDWPGVMRVDKENGKRSRTLFEVRERFNGWTPNPYYNGWGDFDRVRDVIAEALTEGSWLLGERFTVADIYLASDLRIACAGKLISADHEPFAGYLDRVGKRPAFVRAIKIDADAAA